MDKVSYSACERVNDDKILFGESLATWVDIETFLSVLSRIGLL